MVLSFDVITEMGAFLLDPLPPTLLGQLEGSVWYHLPTFLFTTGVASQPTNQPTDRPTDRPTNQPTNPKTHGRTLRVVRPKGLA